MGFSVSKQATTIITPNHKVYWCGTNSIIQNINVPIEVEIPTIVQGFTPSKHLIPIKLMASWNRSISTVSVLFADFRNLQNCQLKMQHNIIEQISQKWEETNSEQISMPYIKHFSQYFYKRFMVKAPEISSSNCG